MASPILAALTAQVARNIEVEASAKTLIDGISARVQEAVNAALALGASAEEMAPVQAEVDAMNASSIELAASVAANTPAAARR